MEFEEAVAMEITQDHIAQFRAVAGDGLAEDAIKHHLLATNGDLERAVNHYFASMSNSNGSGSGSNNERKRAAPEPNDEKVVEPEQKRARIEEKEVKEIKEIKEVKERKETKEQKAEKRNMAMERRLANFQKKNLVLAISKTFWVFKHAKTYYNYLKLKPDYFTRTTKGKLGANSAACQLQSALYSYTRQAFRDFDVYPELLAHLENLARDYKHKIYECYIQTLPLTKRQALDVGFPHYEAENVATKPIYQLTFWLGVKRTAIAQSLSDTDNTIMNDILTEMRRYHETVQKGYGADDLAKLKQEDTIAPVMLWSEKQCVTSSVHRLFEPSPDKSRWLLSRVAPYHGFDPFIPESQDALSKAYAAFETFQLQGGCGFSLKPYQEEAVKWMMMREFTGSANKSLFLESPANNYFYSPQLRQFREELLPETAGGFLADEMGLGKTVEVTGLVVAGFREARKWRIAKMLKYKAPAIRVPPPVAAPLPVVAPADGKEEKKAIPKTKGAKKTKKEARAAAEPLLPLENLLPTQATLIIVPTSCAGDWQEHLIKGFDTPDLKVDQPVVISWYDNKTRCKDLKKLAQADVIITTYPIVETESRQNKKKQQTGEAVSILQQLYFHRIVLDESQNLASAGARSRAILKLRAANKWCLGGTLMRKDLFDLLPQLQFLDIVHPLTSRNMLQKAAKTMMPSYQRQRTCRLYRHHVFDSLFALMSTLVLRRKTTDRYPNGQLICPLPSRTWETVLVQANASNKEKLDELHFLVYQVAKIYKDLDIMNSKTLTLQSHLMALRIWCSCGEIDWAYEKEKLESIVKDMSALHASNLKNKEEVAKKAQEILQRIDPFGLLQSDCVICIEPITDAAQTNCHHVFCYECINSVAANFKQQRGERALPPCPMCRTPVSQISSIPLEEIKKKLNAAAAAQVAAEQKRAGIAEEKDIHMDEKDEKQAEIQEQNEGKEEKKVIPPPERKENTPPGEKLEALLEQLKKMKQADPRAKAVVYTDIGRTKEKTIKYLQSMGFRCGTINGSMPFPLRKRNMDRFQETDDEDVFVLSLKSNSEGLTLTRACWEILMDPGLVSPKIMQAIRRVYRFGQTKPVKIVQLIMQDTIEEAIGDRYCKEFEKSFAAETKLNQDILDGKVDTQQLVAQQSTQKSADDVMTDFIAKRRKVTKQAMKASSSGANAAELFKLISSVQCVKRKFDLNDGMDLGGM